LDQIAVKGNDYRTPFTPGLLIIDGLGLAFS